MGPNAYLERYEKPNYRLHAVIFLIIVAVSIFLSTQVEKSKEKTNVAALKSPVPIDSVTLAEKTPARQMTPRVKPSVTKAPVDIAQSSDSALSGNETEQEHTLEQHQADAKGIGPLAENDVAERVKDSAANSENVESETAANEPADEPLEEVFDHQHDRFLQTLAKTANLESKETAEVRKIKQAIQQDKPLETASAAQETKPKQKKQVSSPQPEKTTTSSTRVAKQSIQQPESPQARTAAVDSSVPVALRQSKPVTPLVNKSSAALTTKELNRILSNFTNSYNKGNIGQLMSLFDDNAKTNDRSSKRGIQADYAELFSNTQSRKLMINDINWRVRQGKAEGAATFEVVVQPKNSAQANRIRGSIRIVAEKNAEGVYITRLVHDIQQ